MLSFDGTGAPQFDRIGGLLLYEQCLASDSLELFHQDYSYKAVKTLVPHEQMAMKQAQERLTIPVHYGSQPDLGRYSEPDGPCPNWSTLLPELRIDEARAAQEQAMELAVDDMVHVAEAHVGGRRRRHQLRHRRRRRRRRPAGDAARRRDPARAPPRHGHHGRHGRRARARHARRARIPGHARRRAVAGRPAEARRSGRGDDLRPGGQRQHGSQPRLEHEPCPGAGQALHGRARASRCT